MNVDPHRPGSPMTYWRQVLTSRWRWASLAMRESFPALCDALHAAAEWASRTWGPDAETTGYPAFRWPMNRINVAALLAA